MIIDKTRIPTKLLWVDLEMTGLDPGKDVILEIAAQVTDFSFQTVGTYDAVIKQSDSALENMNEWAAAQHAANGLTERVRQSGRSEREVECEFADFIARHFGEEPAVLAGNSIHNDRMFIRHWWPLVENRLHYRMLDVSSFKVLMQGQHGIVFEKNEAHRAQGDIQESIAELGYYLAWLKEYHD